MSSDETNRYADPVWEQAPDESDEDFLMFMHYLELPLNKRSVRAVLRAAGMHEGNQRVQDLAKHWEWDWRTLQYHKHIRQERLNRIREAQLKAQDVIVENLVNAALALIGGMGATEDDYRSAGVKIRAATAILTLGGIQPPEPVPLDVESAETEDVEEVWVIDGEDDVLEELADYDDEEE